ncbi:cilia- and flagella-associated protein 119 isoform X2 [Xiphophorus couchianus]|uniref:cilia- and flagella-associated protein 119 isoform X2 n=2 Tax=Xiphophorus couchianus TaxID=32473 RepID=UPI0010171D7F|nr:coiled-coil domain-containing protein 189 isoform X2 [Xiphophorus couchianus]
MDTNIKVPRDLIAKLLLWTDISFHDMEVIDQIQSVPDLERSPCAACWLSTSQSQRKESCWSCTSKRCFSAGSRASVRSRRLHWFPSSSPSTRPTLRPPFSVKLFSLEEANCVLNYIQDHYLRHDKLYKYIFTPQVKLDLFLTYSGKGGEGLAEDESAAQADDSSEAQKTMEEETAEASVDLKALVEQEVKEQMEQVSKQLDQRIKETASEQSSRAQSAKPGKKGKK